MFPVSTLSERPVSLIRTFLERRRTRRFSCNDQVQLSDPATGAFIANATLHDASTGGIALRSTQYLAPCTALDIRGERLKETATVRHCTRSDSGFIIGCEFRRPLLTLWF
jgi:hypothetical protein